MIQSSEPMDYVWAPWRMPYIEDESEEDGCVFCRLLDIEDGPKNLILKRHERVFVMLNRYPYTNGHLMIVPFEHTPSIEGLDEDTLSELMLVTRHAVDRLREIYKAEAFNIGLNIGTAAGAGIADHVHIHVVPRWGGDTNFMSTTAKTRVLPEALEVTYERLRAGWNSDQ